MGDHQVLGPQYGNVLDTGDVIRSRVYDVYDNGRPSTSLDVLLGGLGVFGSPIASQQAALRDWLETTAAIPAPPKLLKAVHAFLEVDSD